MCNHFIINPTPLFHGFHGFTDTDKYNNFDHFIFSRVKIHLMIVITTYGRHGNKAPLGKAFESPSLIMVSLGYIFWESLFGETFVREQFSDCSLLSDITSQYDLVSRMHSPNS